MAKSGTLRHPKTYQLADLLGVSLHAALGVLEALWETTGDYAPQGDIGRHSDAWIADSMLWKGEPAELINCLVGAGWLDRCDDNRLVIHDWAEHCPSYIRKRVERSGKQFATCGSQPEDKPELKESETGAMREPQPPVKQAKREPRGSRKGGVNTENGSHAGAESAQKQGSAADPTRAEVRAIPTQPNPTQARQCVGSFVQLGENAEIAETATLGSAPRDFNSFVLGRGNGAPPLRMPEDRVDYDAEAKGRIEEIRRQAGRGAVTSG
jgi:hypothetical protein